MIHATFLSLLTKSKKVAPRTQQQCETISLPPSFCRLPPFPGVADVYVDNRSRVWLLDVNPFSAVTDSLLFDWSEDALAAPLPPTPAIPPQQGEEALPPGVFMRVHFDPAPRPRAPPPPLREDSARGGSSAAEARVAAGEGASPSDSVCSAGAEAGEGRRGNVPRNVLAGATGFTLAGAGEERGFELRCVPSSLHMVPDPMGRYRGPADVGMGTLMCGTGGSGGLEVEDMIQSCRLAGDGNES